MRSLTTFTLRSQFKSNRDSPLIISRPPAMPGVCHWGPLIAIGIITVVSLSSTYCAYELWSLPLSTVRYFRGTHFFLMYSWLVPIFVNFYFAMKGPKYVPFGWKPEKSEDEKYLQYCSICKGFKPPRSHHCKQCKRCIMKMDHHCPWINSCVGYSNHAYFTRFLFFVPFGCMHAVIINSNFIYRLFTYAFVYNRTPFPPSSAWLIFTVTGISLGAGTTVGVIVLFLAQMKSICTNRTQIEDWIMEKAHYRRRRNKDLDEFVYPYNLGFRRNFSLVINWSLKEKGDGIHWEVKENCFEYAFTVEQIEQKKEKQRRAITCAIKEDYNGSNCPIRFGLMTCLCAPRCDEGKIPVAKGDIFTITRWQRRWVYGDKKTTQSAQDDDDERVRGWFPRRCVKIPEHPHHHHSDEDHASSTQTNDKGDVVKSSPTSATSSPSKGKEVKDGSLKEKDKSKSSLSQGSGATGTTPTSGARKRAKKDKKKETEK